MQHQGAVGKGGDAAALQAPARPLHRVLRLG